MISIKYIAIHVTDHCNLNCIDCSHFSPYRKHKEYQAEEYLPWIDLLSKQATIECLGLTGGESFLHKNLIDFVKKIKLKIKNIVLLTNGFWLKEENINKYKELFPLLSSLQFTKYKSIIEKIGGENKFNSLIEQLKKEFNLKIDLNINSLNTNIINEFDKIEFTETKISPKNCGYKNCPQLLTNGMLLKCPIGYSVFSTQNVSKSFTNSKELFYDLKNPKENLKNWLDRFPFDSCYYCRRVPTEWKSKGFQIHI